jgi:hypothetical protein
MTTRRGFFGVLAGIPLAVKGAFDGAGRRKSDYPLFDEAAEQIEAGDLKPVDNNIDIDMLDLPKIDAVRFYDKKGNTILTPASFVPSQLYRAGSLDPMGSVKTGRLLLPPPPERFTILRYELLDKNGKTLLGPAPVANASTVTAGDAVDIALEGI